MRSTYDIKIDIDVMTEVIGTLMEKKTELEQEYEMATKVELNKKVSKTRGKNTAFYFKGELYG